MLGCGNHQPGVVSIVGPEMKRYGIGEEGGGGEGYAREVLGPDDEAPPCPDGASGRESRVLREGERLDGAEEVGGAG